MLIPAIIFAQDIEKERNQNLERLGKLRKEIRDAEILAEKAEKEQAKLSDQLAALDKKISLRKRLLEGLEKDLRLTEKDLASIRKRIRNVRSEASKIEEDIETHRELIANLRKIVSQRTVYVYKHWRSDELELILTSENFNQALTRKKYFNIIAECDRKNVELLAQKKSQLNDLLAQKLSLEATLVSSEQELENTVRHKNNLIAESKRENDKLASERKSKKSLLDRAKRDHASLMQNIADKRAAAEQIERLIAELESRLAEGRDIAALFPDLNVASLKGYMDWPAEGSVISRFGRNKNPVLNTWTENTGIDIKAPAGTNVRVVASGKVTVITWLRGYGSTLIVSHPGDYYTVYTHLEDILVTPGSIVTAGNTIGTVGESGSLEGAKLHFEIWEKRTKLDPELWLKKRG